MSLRNWLLILIAIVAPMLACGDDDGDDQAADAASGADPGEPTGTAGTDEPVRPPDAGAPPSSTDDSGTGPVDAGGASVDAGANTGTDAGAPQVPGEPTVLVAFGLIRGIGSPEKIEVDDEYVYWTGEWVGEDPPTPLPAPSGTYLLRVPKNGGEVSALYETTHGLSTNFEMDATSLYVSEGLDIYHTFTVKVAKDGSGTEQIAQPEGLNKDSQFAIDDENLYFEGEVTGEILSVALEGGPIVTLIDDENTPFPDGFDHHPFVNGLTTDGTNLYYCDNDGMFQVPVSGGQALLLHTRNMDGARISGSSGYPAVKDGIVYWNYYGYVYSVPVGGGEPTTVVEPTDIEKSGSGPYTAIDGDYVYYLDRGLQKAALDGSSRVTLLEDTGNYNMSGAMAFDDTSVYVHAYSGQGVIKLPK